MGKFKSRLTLLLALHLSFILSFAQTKEFALDSAKKINFNISYQGFFDNREFNQVQNQLPTTFFGHRLELAANLQLDSNLFLTFGINSLQEFGSPSLFSFAQSTIYIHRKGENNQFLFGSFPRSHAVDFLPRALLSDTISYYRPNITGLSYKHEKGNYFFSSWVDWTSQKTTTQREHFHLGAFSKTDINQFSFQVHSLLSHLANNATSLQQKPLEESLMNQVALQYLFKLNGFWHYQPTISFLYSLERIRNGSPTRSASSILVENSLSNSFIELKHTWKRGNSHFVYSGDPFYQYANYARLDLLLQTKKSKKLHVQGGYSLHFIEQRLLHQQRIAVKMQI